MSIPHPRNQFYVANFYARYSASIVYYASRGSFSIRHPVSVARKVFFNDKLHKLKIKKPFGVEVYDGEYEQFGSYFVYEKYNNIHEFFESYSYQRCEKKYNEMLQLDISKCFDSIYTHSVSWAILGKSQTKRDIKSSDHSFGGKFDEMIRNLNNGETKGILIGPEVSRIFAEIILQKCDISIMNELSKIHQKYHKIHYEVFRYVDDYFIFYRDPAFKDVVTECVQEAVKDMKLSVNMLKMVHYTRPIITSLTIAKQRISKLVDAEISPTADDVEITSPTPARLGKRFKCKISTRRLIASYKEIISETSVEYSSVLNYTFSIIERKIDAIVEAHNSMEPIDRNVNQERIAKSIRSVFEFVFFIYSASPSANLTVKTCRLISNSVDFLNENKFLYENKHMLCMSIHSSIRLVLDKDTMGLYREIESLYLLVSLSSTGKMYWLPESLIAKHFLIEYNEDDNRYVRNSFLSHFSITVLLFYMKRKVRYRNLRQFIESHVVDKIQSIGIQCHEDAEALMLFLDMIVCPYVRLETKDKLAGVFGFSSTERAEIQSVNDYWFTAWDQKFDLSKALDLKRRLEVY